MARYHERSFTKLGYSAASIINALPYLKMFVKESPLSYQHIQAVSMFLDSELFKTELAVLAYFTHMVSLPLLYCVEVNSQEGLLKIFPELYNNPKIGKLDTISDYLVVYPQKINHVFAMWKGIQFWRCTE